MRKTKLNTGTKIELELYDESGIRSAPVLISQFEDVFPDESMEILSPILEGRIYPVHRGTHMGVIYEKEGELYKFDAVALERTLEGNIHILKIKPISAEEPIQRRNFFRFNCVMDVEYRFYAYKDVKPESRGDFIKGITKDISGGGICLCSDKKPEYGWYVEGILMLKEKIKFVGRVVRVINVHDRGKFNYDIGIEFDDIGNMSRERVIGFIFDEQRKLLKKGWTK